jgi:hypothetical protein
MSELDVEAVVAEDLTARGGELEFPVVVASDPSSLLERPNRLFGRLARAGGPVVERLNQRRDARRGRLRLVVGKIGKFFDWRLAPALFIDVSTT